MKVKAALLAMAMRQAKISLILLAWELNMKQKEFVEPQSKVHSITNRVNDSWKYSERK